MAKADMPDQERSIADDELIDQADAEEDEDFDDDEDSDEEDSDDETGELDG